LGTNQSGSRFAASIFSPPGIVRESAEAARFKAIAGGVTGREQMNLTTYLPALMFLAVASVIGIALLVLGSLLGPKKPGVVKQSPYECGFIAFEDARMKFDVRYYLMAILFIVFDLEIAFIFPWAVVFRDLGVLGMVEMSLFLGLLLVGFIYAWKKGALEWE
jgi:NADH-quinone oxidoreductase subunit A